MIKAKLRREGPGKVKLLIHRIALDPQCIHPAGDSLGYFRHLSHCRMNYPLRNCPLCRRPAVLANALGDVGGSP